MINVKFVGFGEEKVVQASTGDLLLRIAYKNGILLPKDCEDGECGTCTVNVQYGAPYTEYLDSSGKELRSLVSRGIYTSQEAEKIEQAGIPPHIRLACQFVVRCDCTVSPY